MLEEIENEEEEEMKVDVGYQDLRRKEHREEVTPRSNRTTRRLGESTPVKTPVKENLQEMKEEWPGSPSTTGWDMVSELTKEEIAMITKKREKAAVAKTKAQAVKALTGEQANYPTLSHVWSQEVAMNLVFSTASRMRVFLWKKLVWQLRVKDAVEKTARGVKWKRNPRWLAMLFSKEVAALWGHFGSMRQRLNNKDVWHLM